jgi:decaprenyl-phosphate phosphoribosyltransferase
MPPETTVSHPVRGKLRFLVQLARPHQYLKNGFIFLPVFFGHRLFDHHVLVPTCWAFVAFCLAASSVYVVNDIHDVNEDRQHPAKKSRPLAAGLVSRSEATLFSLVLAALSLAVVLTFLTPMFLLPLGAYLLLNLTYSYGLKHLAIIDVCCIGVGFVLRVFAGGVAADIMPSHWLVLMTFLLALFLALAKRRDDLILAANGQIVRRNLDNYSLEFVSLSMVLMAAVIIVSYILYTVSPEVVAKHKTNNLYLTSLWVIIGLLRYMQIAFVEQRSGSPTLILLKDSFLQGIILLWLLSYYLIFYVFGQ